ncbi:TonB-dependent receptor [Undibacterium seohonense]|uniref:TonB-dependent receptor n=1 Tax=Undibacterium seohonense TaxID=1344950 RepID=A0ABR6X1Y9_9BURK|nr:TonB-dependent receptor [Undibacterium seohonense]MBC3806974.1 TonB-dependent receptor [Undibacterium seohonense]
MKKTHETRDFVFKKTVLVLSLMAGMSMMHGAHAQSITGGLYGSVPSGDKVGVIVTNSETGFKRELQTDAQGRYKTSGLNPGLYTIKFMQGDKVIAERVVNVKPNSESAVVAITAEDASGKSTAPMVVVSGQSAQTVVIPIDVSTPELTSSYSQELINHLPLAAAASPETIALLRSSVRHDSNTTGLVQLGGASPAENRYYLNEFDTTNDRTSLGSNRLPREAIQNTEVMGGSFGASWTNATGGIMSQTIRQGSNQFKAGYSMYFTPATSSTWSPPTKDIYAGDGSYYSYSRNNRSDSSTTHYLWGSGALIKDKLFAFVLLGDARPSMSYGFSQNRESITTRSSSNVLLNLTWNINDDHTVNLIGSRNWSRSSTDNYRLTEDYSTKVGAFSSHSDAPVGQRMLIANYHGNLTNDLDVRLMGGFLGQINDRAHGAEDVPYVDQYDSKTQRTTNIGVQDRTVNFRPDDYWRRGFKGDLTWRLGNHKIVFGGEYYKHFLGQDWHTPNAGWYTYYDRSSAVQLSNGEKVSGQYVGYYFNRESGQMVSENKAMYLEDYWKVVDNVIVYGGLRFDKYVNKDALARPMFSFPMTSPRVGVAWDVNGDSSLKVGGNLGRYSLSMPSNFSFGVGESHLEQRKWYRYTGIDPATKAPLGLTQIGATYTAPGRDGIPPHAYEVSTTNLKAPYQDELQLYVQKALSRNWVGQVDFGYADLKRVVNTTCYGQGIAAWANSHGYPKYPSDYECFVLNPGEDVTVMRDFRGDGTLTSLTIPASAFGLPKPKHKYIHMTFDASHSRSAAEPWYLNMSYTWTRSFGNDNGFLDLERRNAGYIGQTGIYDFPETMRGANGNLTNDVRHAARASGAYYFSNGIRTSGMLSMNTGQPMSCIGLKPDVDSLSYNWGSWGHYCDASKTPVGVKAAGTSGRLPFFWQFDFGIGYDVKFGEHNKLSIDLSIQNLNNRRGIVDRYNTYSADVNADNTIVQDINWGIPSQYQAPRRASLVLRYSFF